MDYNKSDLIAYANQVAIQHGIDPAVFHRQIMQESGFSTDRVSKKGAAGIAQIMPATAKSWGVNPFDPIASLDVMGKHMGSYLKTYNGDYPKALAAYNAGPGAVAHYGGVPPYPETHKYLKDILGSNAVTSSSTSKQQEVSRSPKEIASKPQPYDLKYDWSKVPELNTDGSTTMSPGAQQVLGLQNQHVPIPVGQSPYNPNDANSLQGARNTQINEAPHPNWMGDLASGFGSAYNPYQQTPASISGQVGKFAGQTLPIVAGEMLAGPPGAMLAGGAMMGYGSAMDQYRANKTINPGQVGVDALAGALFPAIPGSKAESAMLRMLEDVPKYSAASGAATAASNLVANGDINLKDTLNAMGVGGLFGAASGLFHPESSDIQVPKELQTEINKDPELAAQVDAVVNPDDNNPSLPPAAPPDSGLPEGTNSPLDTNYTPSSRQLTGDTYIGPDRQLTGGTTPEYTPAERQLTTGQSPKLLTGTSELRTPDYTDTNFDLNPQGNIQSTQDVYPGGVLLKNNTPGPEGTMLPDNAGILLPQGRTEFPGQTTPEPIPPQAPSPPSLEEAVKGFKVNEQGHVDKESINPAVNQTFDNKQAANRAINNLGLDKETIQPVQVGKRQWMLHDSTPSDTHTTPSSVSKQEVPTGFPQTTPEATGSPLNSPEPTQLPKEQENVLTGQPEANDGISESKGGNDMIDMRNVDHFRSSKHGMSGFTPTEAPLAPEFGLHTQTVSMVKNAIDMEHALDIPYRGNKTSGIASSTFTPVQFVDGPRGKAVFGTSHNPNGGHFPATLYFDAHTGLKGSGFEGVPKLSAKEPVYHISRDEYNGVTRPDKVHTDDARALRVKAKSMADLSDDPAVKKALNRVDKSLAGNKPVTNFDVAQAEVNRLTKSGAFDEVLNKIEPDVGKC